MSFTAPSELEVTVNAHNKIGVTLSHDLEFALDGAANGLLGRVDISS